MTETTSPPTTRYARELTTLVVGPLLIWFVVWVPLAFAGLAVIASILAHWEFLALGTAKGWPMQRVVPLALLILLLVAILRDEIPLVPVLFLIILLIPAIYSIWRIELDHAMSAAALCVLSTLYVGMTGAYLIKLRLDFDKGGPLVFFLLIVVWANDAGAYYTGRTFGKTKLSPRVSPKKTVEGLIGGLVSCVVAGAVLQRFVIPEFPLLHALIAAFILGLAGVVGDLVESVWKRSAGVKDSGNLIPGHGGFLDRIDSVFFTAPILYSYWFVLEHGPGLIR